MWSRILGCTIFIMDKITLQPNFVLIEKLNQTKTASGIAIPDAAQQNLQKGQIVKAYDPTIEKKKVIYWINPEKPHYENDKYIIVSKDYILGII